MRHTTTRALALGSLVLPLGAVLAACEAGGPLAPSGDDAPLAAIASSKLGAPSGASAVAASDSRVDVAWLDNSTSETGFQVHRSTTGATGTFALRATMGANAK